MRDEDESKVLVNTIGFRKTKIRQNRVQLEEVQFFKYLYATISRDCSSTWDIHLTIIAATEAMVRQQNLDFSTKFRLYKSLIVPIMLYGWKTWTLLPKQERQIQAFDMKCFRILVEWWLLTVSTSNFWRFTSTAGSPDGPLSLTRPLFCNPSVLNLCCSCFNLSYFDLGLKFPDIEESWKRIDCWSCASSLMSLRKVSCVVLIQEHTHTHTRLVS